MLFSARNVCIACLAAFLLPATLSARDVTHADYSRQAWSGDQRFSTQQKQFHINEDMASKRFDVKDWHTKFSGLGRKRANVDMTPTSQEVITHETLSFDRKDTSMSRFEGRQAYIRNFGEVERSADAEIHEDATVRRFEGPLREVRSELGDAGELSMEDLNRFFYMRNKPGASTSGEIPIRQPGSSN